MVDHSTSKPPRQSYWYYLPIVLVLAIGYAVGGALAFGVYFLGWFEGLTQPVARLTLSMFGMGVLGATLYASRWWSIDMDEAIAKTEYLPHLFDAFGYATSIVAGGIMGVVLYLATRAGIILVTSDGASAELRPGVALLVAFCGGLSLFKVQDVLKRWIQEVGLRKR